MSYQNITLKARGLYTFPNALSEVPDGALSEAVNVVIDRDSVINPRRGFKLYGNSFGSASSRSKQLMLYKGRILRHWSTELDVDSDGTGTFTAMKDSTGSNASITEVTAGTRIKFIEANGNLYFTSSQGIKKISCLDVSTLPSQIVTSAGGIKALDGYAQLNSQTGWFTEDSVVAYRIIWGIRDNNTNVIEGVPSEQIIIYNPLLSLLIGDFNTLVADLATVEAVAPLVRTGDEHTSTTIDNITTTGFSIGMTVTGTNIPANTTITAVASSSITISNAATGTASGVSLTFGQKLSDTDYASLKISLNSGPTVLYAALKALANGASNKLDNDLGGTTFQSISLPSAPNSPATTGQLVNIQTYFDAIVNALNIHPGIGLYAKAAIGGAFSNSTQSATTNVIFTVPTAVTTAHFYQVYRSAIFASSGASTLFDVSPDDELRLIFEDNPTTAELAVHQVNFFDNVPDSFRVGGANLYTNANSGEGINQANEVPPLAKDIAQFKNSTFFANTQTKYSLNTGLLTAVGIANGKLTVAQASTANTYTFVNSVQQAVAIQCIAGGSFTSSGTADYFDIYSANNTTTYRVWFQVGTSVAPSAGGATLVQCTILGGDTNAQVATKLQNALTTISDFVAVAASSIVTVTNENTGPANSPVSHVASGSFTLTVTISGSGEDAPNLKVGVSNASTPAQEVDETARSLVRVINKNPNETVYAFYVSGPDDIPGLINFEARTLGDPNFYVSTNTTAVSQKFNPDFGTISVITAISSANPAVVTCTAHGLITGQQIVISGSDCTPSLDGLQTVTVLTANTFSVPVHTTISGSVGGFILATSAKTGDNSIVPNRIYYSKFQQPEAVPLVNYQDVGPKNKKILRILPLRDNLFILSEAGVYRLSGDDVSNFQISLFDSSTQLKATDSAVVLNNQIYMFSSQGIATISDTGIQIISRPIENKLLPLVTSSYPSFVSSTFAVSYESDRAYILFTVSETSDTVATIAYRYNTFTNTWVSWDISKTCAVINTDQDRLYLGAGDTDFLEVERKTFTRLDYADRENALTVPSGGVSGDVLSLGSLFGTTVGDVFVQTQYLTIAQLNRLLRRLDTDAGLAFKNYYSSLGISAGVDLRNSLTLLAAKLDSDSGLASHGYAAAISGFSSSFVDTQSAYNTIVGMLNVDSNTRVKTYSTSSGTVSYEAPVMAIDATHATITLGYAVPFIAGTITQFIKIDSTVTWAPHHFGDASMVKQVAEGTILFENMDFTEATASYSSDLSPGFVSVPVPGEGTGIWGGFIWGQIFWGGEGSSRPFRTLIPQDKQRCRYINGKFEHASAFEQYSIYGLSFTYSAISSRGYR